MAAHPNRAGIRRHRLHVLARAIAAIIVVIVFLLGGVIKNAFSHTCGAISEGTSANAASSCG